MTHASESRFARKRKDVARSRGRVTTISPPMFSLALLSATPMGTGGEVMYIAMFLQPDTDEGHYMPELD